MNEVNRSLRIQLSPLKFNIGYESFNYGSIGESYVPPHPQDQDAESDPVNAKEQISFEVTAGMDLTVDFWQYVYLKYQLQWDATSERKDINHDEYGCKPMYHMDDSEYPLCTGKSVPNEQPYAVGENSTFIYANEGGVDSGPSLMHSLSLGFYPILSQTETKEGFKELSFGIEAGVSTKNYALTRGWVREGILKVKDEKEYQIWGATWGLQIKNFNVKGHKETYFGGVRFSLKGTHFIGNSHIFSVEMAVPFGIGF